MHVQPRGGSAPSPRSGENQGRTRLERIGRREVVCAPGSAPETAPAGEDAMARGRVDRNAMNGRADE